MQAWRVTQEVVQVTHRQGSVKVYTFRQQKDVIKQVVHLWGRLQQADDNGCIAQMCKISQALDDLEGGAAVQAGADFIHEEDF